MTTKKRSHRVEATMIYLDGSFTMALVPVSAAIVAVGNKVFKLDRRSTKLTYKEVEADFHTKKS